MKYKISFQTLTLADDGQLHIWLQLPHVREFWDDGDRTIEQVKAHYFRQDDIKRYLFLINEQAAGYIQVYPIDDQHEYGNYVVLQQHVIGIDYFIGNTQFLGHGLAIHIITDFITTHCQSVDRIIVDPAINNQKAIHIYQKYGFNSLAEMNMNNKHHLIMAIDLSKK